MKCPACGFETPDSQNWCDFCKEPFKRPAAEPPARKASEPDPLGGEALKRALTSDKALDLLKQAAGERIPVVPQKIRILAWAFFGLCMIGFLVMSLVLARKAQKSDKIERGENPPIIQAPAPQAPPAPEAPAPEAPPSAP